METVPVKPAVGQVWKWNAALSLSGDFWRIASKSASGYGVSLVGNATTQGRCAEHDFQSGHLIYVGPYPAPGQFWEYDDGAGSMQVMEVTDVSNDIVAAKCAGFGLHAPILNFLKYSKYVDPGLTEGNGISLSHWPHKCRWCKGPAFEGLRFIDCLNKCGVK
jgi:hypothetical protein